MIRRKLLALLCTLVVPQLATAQQELPRSDLAQSTPAAPARAPLSPCTETIPDTCQVAGGRTPSRASTVTLRSLEVSFVALQGLDIVSTMQAIDRGHEEANPLMGSISGSPAAMIGVKAGTSVATLWLVRRLARRHRVAAIITLAAIDAGYTAIVARNFSLPARR